MFKLNILEYINHFNIELKPIDEILRYFNLPEELSYKLSPRILISIRDQYYLEQIGLDYITLIL